MSPPLRVLCVLPAVACQTTCYKRMACLCLLSAVILTSLALSLCPCASTAASECLANEPGLDLALALANCHVEMRYDQGLT